MCLGSSKTLLVYYILPPSRAKARLDSGGLSYLNESNQSCLIFFYFWSNWTFLLLLTLSFCFYWHNRSLTLLWTLSFCFYCTGTIDLYVVTLLWHDVLLLYFFLSEWIVLIFFSFWSKWRFWFDWHNLSLTLLWRELRKDGVTVLPLVLPGIPVRSFI